MKGVRDLKHLPSPLVERLRHYFLTYKMVPGEASQMTIEKVYDREHAMRVVEASLADYDETFGK
jgi:inorganic pyrophosphatase